MTPFLKQVADHYYNSGQVEDRCFIFPNRRSMVFFKKYIVEAVVSSSGKPLIMPSMMTMNEFFSSMAGKVVADRVTLLVTLYECYSRLNPKAESLDDFIFWGDIILGDFNDTDKYLADPRQLFTNVADLKNIQDSFDYLTKNQRDAISALARHFTEKTAAKSDNPKARDVSKAFLQMWNIMYPLYQEFKRALEARGLAYEGMIYRDLADRVTSQNITETVTGALGRSAYVFVGLNALNECEKAVMGAMRDAGIAEFCWDYSGKMISDPLNKSSYFMAKNVRQFKPAFEIDPEGVSCPKFNVLSVPSSYGQVKHLPQILSEAGVQSSAVILPDEGLLIPTLNSMPPEIEDINVTMGYPMSASELWTLMSEVMKMQIHVRRKDGECFFYHKHLWNIFSNALFRRLMEGDDMVECRNRVAQIKLAARYYVSQKDLSGFQLFDVLFRPVVDDMAAADKGQIVRMAEYQQSVISYIAVKLLKDPDAVLEIDFAKEYWCAVNRLKEMNLDILPATYVRLLDSLLAGVAVPFSGEPLKGLQIMGPLETRALDFRNVIIFSCNEGMFPRRNVSSSFIPPDLRKAFSLPTYEYQDAIWAYYFYRLVSRAENVWMVYDSRTEGLKRGEESRYIKQLRYHFGIDVRHHVAEASLSSSPEVEQDLVKTDEMMERIGNMTYSVSALQNYVICPMKFCYESVLQLKKDEDVAESLDNAMIGNVYHNAMWALYHGEDAMKSDGPFEKLEGNDAPGMPMVSASYLEGWLDREEEIMKKVVSLIKAELNTDEISGRDLVVQRVIVRYVLETIRKDLLLLSRYGAAAFEMIGLEKKIFVEMYGVRFFGVVDRIDSIVPGTVRMVDYKTGNDSPTVIAVTDDMAEGAVNRIFDAEFSVRKENKAALQFHIYDRMAQKAGLVPGAGQVCNSLYATSDLFRNVPAVFPMSGKFSELMDERLQGMIDEIRDRNVPFRRTQETDACTYCDFKMICGR